MDPEIAYPRELCEFEERLIATRRKAAGVDLGGKPIGLALSGGGIRSATFSLGILQALAAAKLLRRVDYLSTVSGGGYIGASLGALYARAKLPESWTVRGRPVNDVAPRVDAVEGVLEDLGHDYLRWLREHGRYLSPNGAGDLLLAAAVLLRNWVAVQIVLAVAVGTALLALLYLRLWLGADESLVTGQLRDALVSGFFWHGIWWSPWLAAPLVPLIVGVIPFGWAYWLVIVRTVYNPWLWPWMLVMALLELEVWAIAELRAPSGGAPPDSDWFWPLVALASTTALTIFWFVLVRDWYGAFRARTVGVPPAPSIADRKASAQRWLSVGLESSLFATGVLLALALVDSLGQTAYAIVRGGAEIRFGGLLGGVGTVVGGIVSAAPAFISFFPSMSQDSRPRSYTTAISTVAASLLVFVFLLAVSVGAQAVAWRGAELPKSITNGFEATHVWVPAIGPSEGEHSRRDFILWMVILGGVVTVSIGSTWSFLNQSTHAPLYSARLRRAYVGASNSERFRDGEQSVRLESPGDELPLDEYAPDANGGPLHIVNVTINETIGAESQIEQRDRKGMNLAFGPAGLSAGVRHHATWFARGSFRSGLTPVARAAHGFQVFQAPPGGAVFSPEALPIGRLVAISGAAFTTGLGARTSLAMSLLLGMLNIRLGHWWLSGVDPLSRSDEGYRVCVTWTRKLGWLWRRGLRWVHPSKWFPVQRHLINEFLAKFPGTARENWYLSDGGHFENTACYELIRRRVPLIIVCDNGEDPKCDLTDLGQLVRKARLDFGCEIHFLTQQEIERVAHPELVAMKCLGTVQELSRVCGPRESDPPRYRQSDVYATLAIARYKDGQRSVILWIKPGLNGSEPQDVIEYAVANGSFPQQPTADQFFDEAQWESYRKLGKWIGDSLFNKFGRVAPHWLPSSLDPDSLLALYGSD